MNSQPVLVTTKEVSCELSACLVMALEAICEPSVQTQP